MRTLPEDIDKIEGFYKEQFEDFSPEVPDNVWNNIKNNIPESKGFSVSNAHLLKVGGIMFGAILVLSLIGNFTSTPKETSTETAPVIEEVIEVKTPVVEPVVEEVTTPVAPTPEKTIEAPAKVKKQAALDSAKKEVKTENTTNDNFQFVEEFKP